ncbi:hypothetical protein G7175_000699 [Listeria monocytogenes]|nr:hypothetical protein [Listeria monocytogenes]EED2403095.1 hypothetical protein [Listeria monocytogenes]
MKKVNKIKKTTKKVVKTVKKAGTKVINKATSKIKTIGKKANAIIAAGKEAAAKAKKEKADRKAAAKEALCKNQEFLESQKKGYSDPTYDYKNGYPRTGEVWAFDANGNIDKEKSAEVSEQLNFWNSIAAMAIPGPGEIIMGKVAGKSGSKRFPKAVTKGAKGFEYLDNQLGSIKNKVKVNKYESAETVNAWWKKQGYEHPPYTPKTVVQEIKLLEETKFVRVYDGVDSGLYGGWVMRVEDIKGLTPLQIKEKFALPQLPKYIGEVTFSTIRAGEVNPIFGSKGGGFQFDMMQQKIGEFKEIGKIIDWSGE